jgi:hypothetical protein
MDMHGLSSALTACTECESSAPQRIAGQTWPRERWLGKFGQKSFGDKWKDLLID